MCVCVCVCVRGSTPVSFRAANSEADCRQLSPGPSSCAAPKNINGGLWAVIMSIMVITHKRSQLTRPGLGVI